MKIEKLNKDVAIDLDSADSKSHCPYCGNESFTNNVSSVKELKEKQNTKGVYINTCFSCGKDSVHKDGKQFKKV